MDELENIWFDYLDKLDIAFQPIVNLHSGKLYGVEALLRGVETIGFDSIGAFFDEAYSKNILYTFDIRLREKVLQKFITLKNHANIKLFINLDNRLLEMPNFATGKTEKLLQRYHLQKEMICFEISERHEITDVHLFEEILTTYKQQSYSIAIDDFGIGVSGFMMLYRSTPDIIKIDRFFLEKICKDIKKKILVRNIVHLATQLGITVIAEGVECETEMLICKELGCHLIQGYFIQRPTINAKEIINDYHHIKTTSKNDRRSPSNKRQIKPYVQRIEPLYIFDNIGVVLERFKENHHTPLPVIGKDNIPLGILDEDRMRALVTSPYGRSILFNNTSKESKVKKYIQKCAIVDIHTSMDQIVECFTNYKDAKGIIITNNMEYYGFLSVSDIVGIINERNLASARDQNPLTKMPGNQQITDYINDALLDESDMLLIYFDLNNFKAYNDVYGFRNGDRVIQKFADIMKKKLPFECFKGHIGGDDFFAGIKLKDRDFNIILNDIELILNTFSEDVQMLYDLSDCQRGYIVAKDRNGLECTFELLSVSAVIVQVHHQSKNRSIDFIHKYFASQKKEAKRSVNYINISTLL